MPLASSRISTRVTVLAHKGGAVQSILLKSCDGWTPDAQYETPPSRDVDRLRSKIILRQAKYGRGIVNLPVVQRTLSVFGSVDTVELRAGSICEQARNASGADLYVVPHGAHLVNMVRAAPLCRVCRVCQCWFPRVEVVGVSAHGENSG